jgi:hypothetical protein
MVLFALRWCYWTRRYQANTVYCTWQQMNSRKPKLPDFLDLPFGWWRCFRKNRRPLGRRSNLLHVEELVDEDTPDGSLPVSQILNFPLLLFSNTGLHDYKPGHITWCSSPRCETLNDSCAALCGEAADWIASPFKVWMTYVSLASASFVAESSMINHRSSGPFVRSNWTRHHFCRTEEHSEQDTHNTSCSGSPDAKILSELRLYMKWVNLNIGKFGLGRTTAPSLLSRWSKILGLLRRLQRKISRFFVKQTETD